MDDNAELSARWTYLAHGAAIGANLTHAARLGTEHLTGAVRALGRDSLEAAAIAMAILHAENAPMLDHDPEHETSGA